MRFLIKTFLTALVLVFVGLALVVLLVPKELVRDQVTEIIEQQTGLKLTIAGETSLAFFPNIGVTLEDVALSNPSGIAGGPTVRMKQLDAGLALMPLFRRDVQVRRFIMVQPIFDLRINRDGRPNWLFERRAESTTSANRRIAVKRPALTFRPAQLGIFPATAQPLVRALSLEEVRIEDGIIQFSDERTLAGYRVEAINAALSLPRLTEPLETEGSFHWRGEDVSFKARIDAPPDLLEGGSSPVVVSLDSRLLNGSFDGILAVDSPLTAKGELSIQSPSLRTAAEWAGHPLPRGKGLGSMSFVGRVAVSGDQIAIARSAISLDEMSGNLEASVGLATARPTLRAAVSLDQLDLNAYLDVDTDDAQTKKLREPEPRPKAGQSLTEFIQELDGADPENTALRPVREEFTYDLAILRAVDADIRLTAGGVLYGDLALGRSAVGCTLKDGVLTADLTGMQLYGGTGKGRVILNGAEAVPVVSLTLDLDDVEALPLFKDAMAFDWISGKAQLALDLSGTGRSQSELVRSLRGNGNILFTDGAIEGINIPQMIRSVRNGQFTEWRRQETLKTDFSRLSGTVAMQNGVAKNDDLELIGPLVRLTGSGTVDLPESHVDYRILPVLVASLEGQGAEQRGMSGLVVPLRLEGPLDDPSLRPDLERFMEDPDLVRNTVEQVGRTVETLKSGVGRQLLQDFLGGGQNEEAPTSGVPQESQPADQRQNPQGLLDRLFR